MWKQKATKFFQTLRGKLVWATFTGLVQATVRFIAEYVGIPAAIYTGVVLSAAALIDFITSIPSDWVWLVTAVTFFLTVPQVMRASADLKRASAEEMRAAAQKQKLDHVELGLRGPLARQSALDEPVRDTSRLENLYGEGQKLLERDKRVPPGEWRQQIIDWFGRAESAVAENRPNEAFMFRTISRRPKPDEKFDDCAKQLAVKLVKLRLIIGRMQSE